MVNLNTPVPLYQNVLVLLQLVVAVQMLHVLHFVYSLAQEEQGSEATDSVSVAFCTARDLGLSNLSLALQLLASMPITSCEAERAFSRMKHLKTDLHSTMGHARYTIP